MLVIWMLGHAPLTACGQSLYSKLIGKGNAGLFLLLQRSNQSLDHRLLLMHSFDRERDLHIYIDTSRNSCLTSKDFDSPEQVFQRPAVEWRYLTGGLRPDRRYGLRHRRARGLGLELRPWPAYCPVSSRLISIYI